MCSYEKRMWIDSKELSSAIGALSGLDVNDQITLAKIISDNNKAIKDYIDEKTSPENVTKNFASRLQKSGQTKGMRF
ncbi:hypothetical protein [Psychrobacillus psychrodurans]|uniref:hypothetical protein n=1 Tax=Psychrobacillus psychrodurans TaxID=126157 RepID=UPI003D01087E